jgi:hypothetical protein
MSRRVRIAVLALAFVGACTVFTHSTGFDSPSWGKALEVTLSVTAASVASMVVLVAAGWWVSRGKP